MHSSHACVRARVDGGGLRAAPGAGTIRLTIPIRDARMVLYSTMETFMSKGRKGNKEAKKPKQPKLPQSAARSPTPTVGMPAVTGVASSREGKR